MHDEMKSGCLHKKTYCRYISKMIYDLIYLMDRQQIVTTEQALSCPKDMLFLKDLSLAQSCLLYTYLNDLAYNLD